MPPNGGKLIDERLGDRAVLVDSVTESAEQKLAEAKDAEETEEQRRAREENEALKARIAALEAKVAAKAEVKPAETKFAAGSTEGTPGQA